MTNQKIIQELLTRHTSRFGQQEIVIKSPGRVNIIGEHTDYNDGFSLPFAIEQAIYLVISKNDLGVLRLQAADLQEERSFALNSLSFSDSGWSRYFINALVALDYQAGVGLDITFGGDLPAGGGVSSSSAITCGFLFGVNELLQLGLNTKEMISLASQAENGIGLNGGILDQTAIMCSKAEQVLRIDFLRQEVRTIPINWLGHFFYLFDSGQKHDLVDTAYNDRRKTCEQALEQLKSLRPTIASFQDVQIADIDLLTDEVQRKRVRHVIEENQRVFRSVNALSKSDFRLLGQLLQASHESLSANYEVSTPEIDYLVERSKSLNGLLGSRIMGGGFGGCTINLVHDELRPNEVEALAKDYLKKTGLQLQVLIVHPAQGVQVCPTS